MSTKSTITYGPTFHLYREVLDNRYVYLEIEGVPFEASYNGVVVPVPVHIWEHVRRYPGIDLSLADDTDEDIRARVEEYVDERIARYEAAENDQRRALASLLGSIPYGPADAPRDEQVARGVEDYERRREYQRQVRAAIERLDQDAADI